MSAVPEPGLGGRVAIVTGSGGTDEGLSIGRAAASLLACLGASVVVVDRDAAAAGFTVASITGSGGDAVEAICDLTIEAECARAVQCAVERWGRLDILVNNLGFTGGGATVGDIERDDWERLVELNLTTTLLMSKHAISAMVNGGSIVNVSSLAAARPGNATGYAVAKAGVETLTRAAALQHGPAGIRVNCVSPGPMWTPIVSRGYSPQDREAVRERRRLQTALHVEGTAWDAAKAIAFLAGDDAAWITGQVLTVDGGAGLR